MLTADQNYIICLLRKSFNPATADAGTPPDFQMVKSIIFRNSILLTVYSSLPSVLQQSLRDKYLAAVAQNVQQEYWGEQVLKALSDAGFHCIALKGWELRKLYPETIMRQMTDLDILIRPYEFDKLESVLEGIGFSVEDKSSHKHDSFVKDRILLETHKRLMDDSEIVEWEESMWDRALPVDGNVYKMSPEDFYVFHFVHLHRDFTCGSLALRRIVDTWLLQKQTVNMDTVETALEKFGIWSFHQRMVKLSRATMGEEPMDDNSEILLNHAFMFGLYGTDKSHKAARLAAIGGNGWAGKVKSALVLVFPPYERMKVKFPILVKRPVLLPWCWGMRIAHFLRGGVKKNIAMLDNSSIEEADYQEMKRFFEAGGIQ